MVILLLRMLRAMNLTIATRFIIHSSGTNANLRNSGAPFMMEVAERTDAVTASETLRAVPLRGGFPKQGLTQCRPPKIISLVIGTPEKEKKYT